MNIVFKNDNCVEHPCTTKHSMAYSQHIWTTQTPMADYLATQRQQLLEALSQAGVHNAQVLSVIAKTPRERFVDEVHYEQAYVNRALPIDMGQTISQPLMVAVMTQALHLTGTERVLEIGTGSGYQTAILSQLARYIYSV